MERAFGWTVVAFFALCGAISVVLMMATADPDKATRLGIGAIICAAAAIVAKPGAKMGDRSCDKTN